MPIVTINSLPPADLSVIPTMLDEIRDVGAKVLGCSSDNIWVMFQNITPGYYVQGHEYASMPQENSHPPVVIVRAQAGRTPNERSGFVLAIAAAVSKGLSVPSKNIWIHYQEMNPQDVWFEGHWSGK